MNKRISIEITVIFANLNCLQYLFEIFVSFFLLGLKTFNWLKLTPDPDTFTPLILLHVLQIN